MQLGSSDLTENQFSVHLVEGFFFLFIFYPTSMAEFSFFFFFFKIWLIMYPQHFIIWF